MKSFLICCLLMATTTLFAQTDFRAVVYSQTKTLTVTISDDGRIPPFEGGSMWNIMKGTELHKVIRANGFNLECFAVKGPVDVTGDCRLNIPIDRFVKIGELLVFKLKGAEAAKLNKYFIDSAYLSIQRGRVYLSSYNTRREFFFGIEDAMIERQD